MTAALKLEAAVDSEPEHSHARLSHAIDTSWLGKVIEGRYQIQGVLGQSTLGTVYLAHHVHTRKSLALKLLDPALAALGDAVPRFEREAVATARINHPNVVAASDFGRLTDGVLYLVLEHVKGPSLREALDAGAFEIERALSIAEQVLHGLAAAHALGVVHRGVKPENVLLVQRAGTELVKLQDFGLSILAVDDCHEDALTRLGTSPGTPEYMAPEQATGHWVDARSDLYAVGIVLYELLAGRVPFAADDAVRLLGMHLNDPAPPLPARVPPELALLVADLLEKDPDRRIQSADEGIARIESVKCALSAARAAPESAPELALPITLPIDRGRGRWLLALAALVVGTALISAWIGSRDTTPVPSLLTSLSEVGARIPALHAPSVDAETENTPAVAPAAERGVKKAPRAPAARKRAARPAAEARPKSTTTRPPAGRRTGPFGIYVPPPDQWF